MRELTYEQVVKELGGKTPEEIVDSMRAEGGYDDRGQCVKEVGNLVVYCYCDKNGDVERGICVKDSLDWDLVCYFNDDY